MARAPTNEKAKRRADQALLATYHEAKLADLVEHVRAGFVRHDAGEIDTFGHGGLLVAGGVSKAPHHRGKKKPRGG